MRTIIKTSIILLTCFSWFCNTYSQNLLITRGDTIELEHKTFDVFINQHRGDVSWQYSINKLDWHDIQGEINHSLSISADSTAYYRAKITEGTCEPVFSDTIYVYHETLKVIYDVDIIDVILNDSVEYGDIYHPLYHITTGDTDIETLVPCTIIVDSTGLGSYYMLIRPVTGLKSTKGKDSNIWEAFKPSLDFLFNYESAIIEFSSKENRTKRNSTIDGKMTLPPTEDDPERFFLDDFEVINGWEGYHANRYESLIDISFQNVKFSLNAKNRNDDGTRASVNLEIGGYLKIDPAIDFRMEYNPKYVNTSDKSFMDYWKTFFVKSPAELLGNTVITLGTLKHLKAISYTNFDYGMQIKLNIEGTAEMSRPIFEVPIAKFTSVYPIGVVPISQLTNVILSIDMSLTGRLEAEYHYEKQNDIVLGFDLVKDGLFKNEIIWYQELDSKTNQGGALVAEIEFAAGIKLIIRHEHYVAGVLGPKLEGSGYLDGSFKTWTSTQTPDHSWEISLDAGLKGKASFDLSLFHYDKLTWNMFESVEKEFFKYNLYTCPYRLKIADGNGQVGKPGLPLGKPLKVEVLDSKGNSLPSFFPRVPVYFAGNQLHGYNGTVTESPVYTINGIAETTWTLDAEPKEQKLLSAFRDAYGSIIGTPVEFNASLEEGATPITGTFTDPRDNRTYKTVTIGAQTWMAENLAYLPLVSPSLSGSYTEPYYYVYNYQGTNVTEAKASATYKTYGVLYNWPAAMNACPTGWHLPTNEEWITLESYLIASGYNFDGTITGNKIAKSLAASSGWFPSSLTGAVGNIDYPEKQNATGFSALPSGFREGGGTFNNHFFECYWWSAKDTLDSYAWSRVIDCFSIDLKRFGSQKILGFSVRCIKD